MSALTGRKEYIRPLLLTLEVPGGKPQDSVTLRNGGVMEILSRSDIIGFVQHPPFAKRKTRVQMKLKSLAINL